MAAPNIDITRPVYDSTSMDDDLDQLRDNIVWLMIQAAAAGYMLPDWDTEIDPGDLDEPSYIELTNASLIIRFNFTWSSGLVTEIEYEYDKGLGGGLETLTGGTATLSYNGSDQLTGITTA